MIGFFNRKNREEEDKIYLILFYLMMKYDDFGHFRLQHFKISIEKKLVTSNLSLFQKPDMKRQF